MIPLHPKFIHFPIALLISALLFALLAILIKNKRNLFKELLFWNLLLGTIGAISAVITGLIAESKLVHNDAIHEIMETHELLGYILTGTFVLITVCLLLRKAKMQIKELILLTVLLIGLSGLLAYSADLGGKMVYEHGAGIIPMEDIINNQTHEHSHESEEVHEHGILNENADPLMNEKKLENEHEGHEH